MPTLRVTAGQEGPELHRSSAALMPLLAGVLARDPGPVTIMVHGFRYQPGHQKHCPHRSLFSTRPSIVGPRIVSWPQKLGLRGQHGEGLGVSFGWSARGSIWQAYRAALDAARSLHTLLDMLHHLHPERPVSIVAHSLGARVALAAIESAGPDRVQRLILLAGAEFRSAALAALRSPCGAGCEVLNVTSRENDLFDLLTEFLLSGPSRKQRTLGRRGPGLPNMATLSLDDDASLQALRPLGFPIAPPQRRVCHWSPYLRAGVFPLYRAFLAGRLDVQTLHNVLPQGTARPEPRPRPWSPVFSTRNPT